MANAPALKVYNRDGAYIAAFKHAEDAAILIAGLGDGTQLRSGHRRIVWTEGKETQPASESYDFVAQTVADRLNQPKNGGR